jgi:hypothetical protein
MTPDEITKLHNSIKHLAETAAKHEEKFRTTEHNFRIVLDSLKRLERIAVAHEARLSRLERKRQ